MKKITKLFIITLLISVISILSGGNVKNNKASAQFPVTMSVKNAVNVTLTSDFTVSTTNRGIWIGTGGTVKVDMLTTGTGILYYNVPSGTFLPLVVSKIYSAANGTTASNLIVVY